jgi:hypothetical protein
MIFLILVSFLFYGCEDARESEPVPEGAEELGLGAVDDLKTDGAWGAALTCKPLPVLPALKSPQIVVSLDGLTLHLTDSATGFDKVFPIGPGQIKNGVSETPLSTGKPGGVFYLRLDKTTGKEIPDVTKPQPWTYAYSCKFWWHDPDTNKDVPVFAGLPFLRLEGAPSLGYAIHGPVDSYTLNSGGKLRRGYVSHGCIRMEANDVLEVFARCKGKKVPVRIQQSVERLPDSTAVDIQQRWALSECVKNEDCNFSGGLCKYNDYSGRGFCTASCTKYCYLDKWGYPESFCVADPDDETKGICTLKSSGLNNSCRRYSGFTAALSEPRFNQPSVTADVCLPGSSGWIGTSCFSDLDCASFKTKCDLEGMNENRPGFCTMTCSQTCPDQSGFASTFCVSDNGKGECVSKCFSQDDCIKGFECTPGVPRFNQPGVTASVCL